MTARVDVLGLPDPNVRGDFYAGVVLKRGIAWVLDVALIFIVAILLVPFTAFTAVFFLPAFMVFVGFIYRWVTIARGSSTWGMRIAGVELRQMDGSPMNGASAFMHTLGYSVSFAVFPLQLISVAMMLMTDRKQGLTDHLIGTAALNRRL